MKSEERHRRQENELVHYLELGAEKTRPHLPIIFGVVGLALGAIIVTSIWSQRQAAQNRAAWDRYQLAVASADVEYSDLFDIARNDENEGSAIQEWAYLAYADRQVRQAAEYYLVDREASLDRLQNVAGLYEELAKGASTRLLRDRAKLGAARVLEMQNKIEEARAAYAKIDGPLAAYAAERIKQLDATQVEATGQWLATAELPSFSMPNLPGTPGARPNFGAEIPATDPASSGAAGTGLDADTLQSLEEVFGGSGDDGNGRYGDSPTGEGAAPADNDSTGDASASAIQERNAEQDNSAGDASDDGDSANEPE